MALDISPEQTSTASFSDLADLGDAEAVLADLASVFFRTTPDGQQAARIPADRGRDLEARYRVLLDQIPAVVFMAYLDQGIGEASAQQASFWRGSSPPKPPWLWACLWNMAQLHYSIRSCRG